MRLRRTPAICWQTDMTIESLGLTRSQSLIWAGQKIEPEAPLYNMALRFDIFAALDEDRFQLAFQKLVDDSDAMRIFFECDESTPRQYVTPSLAYDVLKIDFSNEPDAETCAEEWIDRRLTHQFDLDRCTFDSALLRLSDEHYVWYFNQHHIVTDAWSSSIIFRRVADNYARAAGSNEDHCATVPRFSEFVEYEQTLKARPGHADAVSYWKKRSPSDSAPVRFYGMRTEAAGARTVRVPRRLGARRTKRLEEIAEQDGIRGISRDLTLFKLVAAALFAYLFRIGNGHSVVIGSPTHNRSSLKFRDTIGLFIEMFPLRVEIDDDDTFRELLLKVSNEANAFLKNALPGASTRQGALSYNVVLNFIHARFGDFAGARVVTQWLHPGYGDPGHHLRVQVLDLEDKGDLLIYFDFNESVFGPEVQQSSVRHFLRVFDAMIEDLDSMIRRVPLTSDDERETLIEKFNRTASVPVDGEGTVMDLFARQVRLNPDAEAIREGRDALSYLELDQRSDRLARKIVCRGIDGDRPLIGVCARRSIDLIVALLAVHKAGAGYVPLEPGLPERRLDYILQDTAIGLVLLQADLAELYRHRSQSVLYIDQPGASAEESEMSARLPKVAPSSTAYVIYTSGSSGTPKGVEIDHLGLAGYVRWAIRQYVKDRRLRFPLYSAVGFDLTVTSIFVPLCSGGAIVVYPEQAGGIDLSVLDVFHDKAVDIVKLTPAHLQLIGNLDLSDSPVRALIVGGDDLKTSLAARTLDVFGGSVTIYNEYGPTEAVVGCMIHQYDPSKDTHASVPIGKPADNVRIYVLDPDSNPVPVGVNGEICIARDGLSRGYLNRPDLTAEKFVEDPFVPGGRMYRTGDQARFVDSRTIVYVGRSDDQLKIGAVRIEKAEVEQALLSHHGISACFVDAISPGKKSEDANLRYCVRCGLASNYPNTTFSDAGVCNICTDFEKYSERARSYFSTMDDLRTILYKLSRRKSGSYDCMMLLSGGKDSTFALYKLAEMGLEIYALTLDNGFISEGAKANIRRTVSDLGIRHEFATTEAMEAIFVDSLNRHSSVCYGCFKTIYTLALKIARENGIPCIVTGLSRGQFFETRLTREVFDGDVFDPEKLDREVLDARKVYHRVRDAVTESLDVEIFRDDAIFEEIEFVDFFRYCDVSLSVIYAFLKKHAPWVRPEDTGRSTNCLINDTGIFVHKRKMGYHNYALPYSWDVRLGQKRRDEALAELNDEIDADSVMRILKDIDYDDADFYFEEGSRKLAAYYTADETIGVADLRKHLEKWLPDAMIPSYFVSVDDFPLTSNGKIDRSMLPHPLEQRPELAQPLALPESPLQEAMAKIWRDALRLNTIGIHDNFFEVGGDSILAIQIVAKANDMGMRITPGHLFSHQTISELADLLGSEREGPSNAPIEPHMRPKEDLEVDAQPLVDLDEKTLGKIAALLDKSQ